MRPSRIASIGAMAIALAGAAPAAAHAGSWTAPRAATSAGQSFDPSVAADSRGRIALGFARSLRGANRAEVRQGTLRGGLRGASTLLDRRRHLVDDVTVALTSAAARGPIVVWRRYADRAQRLAGAIGGAGGGLRSQVLTAGRESAYRPRFVSRADGALELVYDRRTTSAARVVLGAQWGFASETPLPGTGIASQPGLAVAADGSRTAAWLAAGRVLTAQAEPVGGFGAATALPAAGYARDLQVTESTDGTVVVAWLASTGQGNAVQIASRPPGGTFGAPLTIVPGTEGAYAPRLAATSAGEILLGWTATGRTSGYASSAGALRLQRLSAAGASVGSIRTLTPAGTRAHEIVLAHDGSGSVLAAWGRVDGAGRRTIQARRLAPGGIVGQIRDLSPRSGAQGGAPVLAGASGAGVAAWTSPTGRIVSSIYR